MAMEESSIAAAEREFGALARGLQLRLQRSERLAELELGRLLVKQLLMDEGALRIRMRQERNHATPHVHLDYGSRRHVVSLQVKPAKVLEGDLRKVPRWLIVQALAWVTEHEAALMQIWEQLQAGGDPKPLIFELRGYV